MKRFILIVGAIAIGFAGAFVLLRPQADSAAATQSQPGYVQEGPFPPGFEQPHLVSREEVDADWSRGPAVANALREKYAGIKASVQADVSLDSAVQLQPFQNKRER